ncbi:MAG: hypothetical protein R3321_01100 [Nitrososphaeraceae archaeon]|nr:hypothetical protein [Nitrososphaeraceae archaeon]
MGVFSVRLSDRLETKLNIIITVFAKSRGISKEQLLEDVITKFVDNKWAEAKSSIGELD